MKRIIAAVGVVVFVASMVTTALNAQNVAPGSKVTTASAPTTASKPTTRPAKM